MFNLWQDNNKWKAELSWGDTDSVQFTITEDDVAVDLTGDTLVLALADKYETKYEVEGTVSGNEVVFEFKYSDMKDKVLPDTTYLFDFWNATTKFTYIEKGQFKIVSVAHEVG